MDNIWESFSKWLSEKTSSPLYFTYIGFFIAWNWKFFQILFLESEKLFTSPRIEYISSELFLTVILPEKIEWAASLVDLLVNYSWRLLPPAVFTYITIVYLPVLHSWAFDIYLENYFTRKESYRKKDFEYKKGEVSTLKKEEKILKETAKVKTQIKKQKTAIKKTLSQEEKWDQEFDSFKETPIFHKMGDMIDILYKEGGKVYHWSATRGGYGRNITSDIIASSHTKGFINIKNSGDKGKEIFELTEKGKYFVDKYLEHIIL